MRAVAGLPLTVKVPALVVLLMVAVSATISERVMSRLVENQERSLRDLTASYLDGLSSSLMPHVLRDDIWEVFDTLDRARTLYGAVRPIETVVNGRDGLVIASSSPDRVPSLAPVPEIYEAQLGAGEMAIDEEGGRAYLRRTLRYEGTEVGAIHAIVDVGHLIAERASVTTTLITTNAILTLLLGAIGYFAIRRMVVPLRVLTDHLSSAAEGTADPIPPTKMPRSGSEPHRLFEAYNRLVAADLERVSLERRIADEERLASLGRLASGVAHEINNPLGGLFNTLETLRRHGEKPAVRSTAISRLERGLSGIRDVVAATLQTYRPERTPHRFSALDIDDVRVLTGPQIRRKALDDTWLVEVDGPVPVESGPMRQTLLNLVLNAVSACPTAGSLSVSVEADEECLRVTIEDSGPGMPEASRRLLATPGNPAPIGEGRGLGLWMARRSVTELGGTIACGESALGGARIEIAVPFGTASREEDLHAVA